MKIKELKYYIFLLAIIGCLHVNVLAQIVHGQRGLEFDKTIFSIEQYKVESGLLSNEVRGIAQDKDGYIYMGSVRGLIRFNGSKFTRIYSEDTTKTELIQYGNPLIDKWNNIWAISDYKTQVNKYDGQKHSVYSKIWPSSKFFELMVTMEGNVFVGNDQGLFIYNETGDLEEFITLLDDPVLSFFPNSSNSRYFVLTKLGVYEIIDNKVYLLFLIQDFTDEISNSFSIDAYFANDLSILFRENDSLNLIKYNPSKGKISSELLFENVRNVSYTSHNSLNIVAHEKIYTFNLSNEEVGVSNNFINSRKLYPFPSTYISANIWNGLKDYKIYSYEDMLFIGDKTINGISEVNSIFVDKENLIWVSTGRMGVFKISFNDVLALTNYDYPINTYSIVAYEDQLLASSDYGIVQVNPEANDLLRFPYLNGLPSATINFLFATNDGRLFAHLLDYGLFEFNKRTKNWYECVSFNRFMQGKKKRLHSFLESNNGAYILGDQALIYTQDWNSFEYIIRADDINAKRFTTFTKWKKNALILSTNNVGFVKVDSSQNYVLLDQNGPSIKEARQIYLVSEDTLLLSGVNKGIARIVLDTFDKIKEIEYLSIKEGLRNNLVHGIVEDQDENFWFSSNDGLGRISKANLNQYFDSKNHAKIEWFGSSQKNINQEYNGGVSNAIFADSKRRLWFANQDGLVSVDLENVVAQKNMPYNINIEGLYVNNTWNSATKDTLLLEKGKRRITFTYSLPNFSNHEVNYFYRINEKNGQFISNRNDVTASYASIYPGINTFEVTARLTNGQVTKDVLTVIVPYYLYERPWFWWSLFLTTIIGLIFVFRIQTKKVDRWRLLNKRVEQLMIEKDRLYNSIVHELNTPISLLIHPLERFLEWNTINKKGNESYEMKEVGRAYKNAKRLQFLVDQVSDVKDLNNKSTLNVERQVIQISSYVKNELLEFIKYREDEDVIVEFDIQELDLELYLDQNGLDRILSNLFMNAYRYNKVNGRIKVELYQDDDAVCLVVSNEGKGIKADEIPYIYKYLYQGSNALGFQGTGIGLYLVKYWVDVFDGKIEVSSIPNQWTTFKVDIPITRNLLRNTNKNKSIKASQNRTVELMDEKYHPQNSLQIHKKNIQEISIKKTFKLMIVDDDVNVLENIKFNLNEFYDLYLISNPMHAHSILNNTDINLMITDINMPNLNGTELVETVRSKKGYKYLPVIYYSALTQRDLKKKNLSTGADIYLNKSVSIRELRISIQGILERETKISEFEEINGKLTFEEEVQTLVMRHISDRNLKSDVIAEYFHLSRATLYRKWSQNNEISLNDYITKIRIKEAKKIIESDQNAKLYFVAKSVGYTNSTHLGKKFLKVEGLSIEDFKAKVYNTEKK